MNLKHLNILLADDDTDDCIFFKEALEELIISTDLTTVHDGEQLMELLMDEKNELPHILFLDLNMPRKNGFECLSEIKQNSKLKDLPVIIFSTSFEQEVVNLLYKSGAQYFIRKPSVFLQFKEIILHALLLILDENISYSTKENFVISVQDNLPV
jgi:CheY-like chemotaxis protein